MIITQRESRAEPEGRNEVADGRISAGWASTSSAPPSATDPTLDQAHDLIEQGTRELEEGNLDGAKGCYEQSIAVQETSGAWFNLGVSPFLPNPVPSAASRQNGIGCGTLREVKLTQARFANITLVRSPLSPPLPIPDHQTIEPSSLGLGGGAGVLTMDREQRGRYSSMGEIGRAPTVR